MVLTHPTDLAAWQRWQAGQRPAARRLAAAVRSRLLGDRQVHVTSGGPRPRLVVALEARKGTTTAAQLAPLAFLDPVDVAVVSPTPVGDLLPAHTWNHARAPLATAMADLIDASTAVLSTGHYLEIGAIARARLPDPRRFVTIQHGLLTPHAPPLAESTRLLAWSAADGRYWTSDRSDVLVEDVGSQLLWEAGAHRAQGDGVAPPDGTPPHYLGQLHGSELPRALMVRAAHDFCLDHGATYRPHPSEIDRASRNRHAAWDAQGIVIDRSGTPLSQISAPIVGVFSTGILEAAARGLPAWAHFPAPPQWLVDFWSRNGIHQWEQEPTPAPPRPAHPPAKVVADILYDVLRESR